MAKAIKKKVSKKDDASLEIKTPYPKEEKKRNQKSDVDFIGGELVKLSNRINELELSLNDINVRLKQVTGRMGL